MLWSNFIGKRKTNTCTVWGYTFSVTPQHLTKEETAVMKTSYDTLGEAALERLNYLYPARKHGKPACAGLSPLTAATSAESQQPTRDLFVLLRDHALEDKILYQLWTDVTTVPSWVCWEQIQRGQDVFYRYGGPALTGLAFQSLLGGMVQCPPRPSCTSCSSSFRTGSSESSGNAFSNR